MAKHKTLLQNSDVFTTTLSEKTCTNDHQAHPAVHNETEAKMLGPGALGCTYEMCAGILDKAASVEQITKEEILEETGYDVPLESIQPISSLWTSVGIAGSCMHVFYAEVTDDMLVNNGGGNDCEGELIEVVYVPVEKVTDLLFDVTKARSTGLCFALMWFEHYKKPHL